MRGSAVVVRSRVEIRPISLTSFYVMLSGYFLGLFSVVWMVFLRDRFCVEIGGGCHIDSGNGLLRLLNSTAVCIGCWDEHRESISYIMY